MGVGRSYSRSLLSPCRPDWALLDKLLTESQETSYDDAVDLSFFPSFRVTVDEHNNIEPLQIKYDPANRMVRMHRDKADRFLRYGGGKRVEARRRGEETEGGPRNSISTKRGIMEGRKVVSARGKVEVYENAGRR